MLKDIGFLVALTGCVAFSVYTVVLLWHGKWLYGTACGFVFAGCILAAFWLAVAALLDKP